MSRFIFCICFYRFFSYFLCVAYVAVFLYAVRWHFTCFINEFAIYFSFLVFPCLTVWDHRMILG